MNSEYKKLWLDALRSGNYKQGKSYLRDENNNFCCLGVLYDIATKHEPEKYQWSNKPINFSYTKNCNYYAPMTSNDDTGICLPDKFANDINISPGGDFGVNLENSLWFINDSKNYSFNTIADIIEKHF